MTGNDLLVFYKFSLRSTI